MCEFLFLEHRKEIDRVEAFSKTDGYQSHAGIASDRARMFGALSEVVEALRTSPDPVRAGLKKVIVDRRSAKKIDQGVIDDG